MPMKETGKKTITAVNDTVKRRRLSGGESRPWIILVVLSLIISIFLFPNILSRPKVYNLGDVAENDIKASKDILLENEALTIKNREEAEKEVPYLYDFDPSASNIVLKVKEALSDTWVSFAVDTTIPDEEPIIPEEIQPTMAEDKDAIRDRFFKILEIPPDEKVFERIIQSGFSLEQ